MNIKFRAINWAPVIGACAFSPALLAHPGESGHGVVTGPMHGLIHSSALAPSLLVGTSIALAIAWLVIRSRPRETAIEQELIQ